MFSSNGSSSYDNEPLAYNKNESGRGASGGTPTIPVLDEKEQMEKFAAQYLREIDSLRRQLAEQQQLLIASKETSLLFDNNGDGAALLEAELSFNVAEVIAQTERHLIHEAKRLRSLSSNSSVAVEGISTDLLDAKADMNRTVTGLESEFIGLSDDHDIPGNTLSSCHPRLHMTSYIHTFLRILHTFFVISSLLRIIMSDYLYRTNDIGLITSNS